MEDNDEQSGPESTDTGATAGATVDADELQRQRDEYYDLLLRKTAEFDNYRKRTDRERQTLSDAIAARPGPGSAAARR